MKVRANLYFNKATTARERVAINGAQSVPQALRALAILLEYSKASRAEILITKRRRLTGV